MKINRDVRLNGREFSLVVLLCFGLAGVTLCAPSHKKRSIHKPASSGKKSTVKAAPKKVTTSPTATPQVANPAISLVSPVSATPIPQDTREHPELWPQQPLGPDKGLIESPVALVPGDDPLVYVTSNPIFKGRVFYIPFIDGQPYLAFRGINEQGEIETAETHANSPSVFYPYQPGEGLSRPRFLLGGKGVSFIQGNVAPFEISRHTRWNMRERSLSGWGVQNGDEDETSPDLRYTALAEREGLTSDAQLSILNNSPEDRGDWQVDHDEENVPDPEYQVTNFKWTPQNTLLYIKFPLDKRPSFQESGIYKQPYHPAIYEAQWDDAEKGHIRKKKVIANSYAPQPSPDGRWIAYFGWLQVKDKTSRKLANPSIFLFNRQSSQTYKVRSSAASSVAWSKDSQQLIVMDRRATYPTAPGQFLRWDAVLSRFNVAEVLAFLKTDPEKLPPAQPLATLTMLRGFNDGQGGKRIFRLRGVSNNNEWVFVDKIETKLSKDGKPSNTYDTNETMMAVNLADGHAEDVFRFDIHQNRTNGWDWYDDSPASP